MMVTSPLVSIIVPAYNNGDVIERSLLSLVNQKYHKKEIIVVYDEGSTDNTRQILSEMQSQFPQLIRVVSTMHVSRSQARNIGWKNASGEIFFFADADDIYNQDYLDKAITHLTSDPNLGGVTVTGASLKLESTFVTNCLEVYSKILCKLTEEGKVKPKWAWVYRRQAFEAVGGFDERLNQAEDKDLYIRVEKAGYSFGFVGGVNWWHTRKGSLRSYLWKCYLAGKRRTLYVMKHKDTSEFFKNIISFWIMCISLLLSPFFVWTQYFVFVAIATFVTYSLVNTLKLGWNIVSKKFYLFLFPIFNLMTYVAMALGYTRGVLLLFQEKITGRSLNWASI